MSDSADSDVAAAARLAALEQRVDALETELHTAMDRDIPLLKGTVRAIIDADIETLDELPPAGRTFGQQVQTVAERLAAVEQQLETLGEIGEESSSKEEKFAAILSFAANKQTGNGKVALSPHDIKGCTGVSRRYAYELIDAMAASVDGVQVREEETIQTGNGRKRKGKALLVDCDTVHEGHSAVNTFTTGGTTPRSE
jgi:hypothetical protein